MTATETTFTADDVLATHFADRARDMAKAEGNTPRNIIWSFIDSGIKEEDEQQFAADWAQFERGAAILDAGYHVTYSSHHVQMLDFHQEQIEQRNPVSPIVQMDAGYVATSQQYCYAALIRNRS